MSALSGEYCPACCGPSPTPDPDMALLNLEKVTASLGAKTVLWELFSFNPPSRRLYVDLCALSQYLSGILINNPGMIDELLDSLALNQPRTRSELTAELNDLSARQPTRSRSFTVFRTRNCSGWVRAAF
jgi:glutamate-ammonia-ligase adenylyltransferase